MEIPAHLGKQFVEFTQLRFASDIRMHTDEQRVKTKEFARGFIRDDFILIRYGEGIVDAPLGEGILEVVCSNSERLQKLDESWVVFVQEAIQEAEGFEEPLDDSD